MPPTETPVGNSLIEPITLVVNDPLQTEGLPALVGRYEVAGEVARGGMGAILKGRDPDLNREIPIKILLQSNAADADLTRRFLDEAQIARQLQHPGIVPGYELRKFRDGRPYFTMKLARGQTLATLFSQRNLATEPRSKLAAAEIWQNTTDLQTIREPAAIANLPAEDRAACNHLWTDVANVLKKTAK